MTDTNRSKIIIVKSQDEEWVGIYVDDRLQYEGSTIPLDVMMYIISEFQSFEEDYEVYWLVEDSMDSLPSYFEEISKELLEQ